jgi:hypothetical protein
MRHQRDEGAIDVLDRHADALQAAPWPQARPAGSLTPRMSVSPRGPFVMKNWS